MDQGSTTRRSGLDGAADLPPRRVYAFAGYIFDVDGCSLTREDGSAVPLRRGELALLREFVQRPGRVLSRDFLLDAVAGRRADPFDRSIDVQVGRLRRKIEPDPKQPSLIVTVPGEGYKFVPSLCPVQQEPDAPPPAVADLPSRALAAPARWSRRGVMAVASGGGLAALAGIAGWRLWSNALPEQDGPGVVVLPFENLSGDPGRQYLADGVTYDIRAMLSRSPDIRVFSAPASLGKTAASIQQAAQQAGAAYAIAGGVVRVGDRVRIVAQLYGAHDGAALWGERYDVSGTNPLGPSEDVANRIYDSLTGLSGRIRREEARIAWRRAAPDLDEYDYYLRSHSVFMNFTWDDVRRARAICVKGLAKFPESALLRALKGFTHIWAVMNFASDNPPADIDAMWRLAKEARALLTGSPLVAWKVHWLMAFADQWHDQDFSGSVEEAQAAIALVPYDPLCRNDLSWIVANAGYFDEAIEWARLAIRHDPNGPSWYFINLVWAYYLAGRYQEALEVRLRPEAAPDIYAALYVRLGRMSEARQMVATAIKSAPTNSVAMEASFPLIEPYRAAYLDDLRKAGMRERA